MIGQIIKGRYRIIKELGHGGVATVYEAEDLVLDRVVAIKILDDRLARDEAFIERFNREARSAAGIRHPNVVTIFDSGKDEDSHFIVMEHLEGRPLKDVLSKGPLGIERTARIAVQIARALAHAHRSGIVHRDIKPANIIVAHDGIAKIADFGIARVLDQPGITRTGKVLGTAVYLSPEQALGRAADKKSDIYSFGIVLFEMLAGAPPFVGKNPVEVAARHATENPPKLHELNKRIPRELSSTVDALLAKDPQERPDDLDEVIEALSPWLGEAEPPSPSAERIPDGRPAAWLGVAVTVCALLAVVAVYVTTYYIPRGKRIPAKQSMVQGMAELKPVVIKDFDPEGNGMERPDEVKFVSDGVRGTTWYTEGYANANFGNLKSGVGLFVDFGGESAVKEIRVRSLAGGWNGQIKASSNGRNWRVVAEKKDVPADYTFKANGAYRYYLLWVTKLTKVPQREGFRVAIDEVDFKG